MQSTPLWLSNCTMNKIPLTLHSKVEIMLQIACIWILWTGWYKHMVTDIGLCMQVPKDVARVLSCLKEKKWSNGCSANVVLLTKKYHLILVMKSTYKVRRESCLNVIRAIHLLSVISLFQRKGCLTFYFCFYHRHQLRKLHIKVDKILQLADNPKSKL